MKQTLTHHWRSKKHLQQLLEDEVVIYYTIILLQLPWWQRRLLPAYWRDTQPLNTSLNSTLLKRLHNNAMASRDNGQQLMQALNKEFNLLSAENELLSISLWYDNSGKICKRMARGLLLVGDPPQLEGRRLKIYFRINMESRRAIISLNHMKEFNLF